MFRFEVAVKEGGKHNLGVCFDTKVIDSCQMYCHSVY